MQADVTLPYKPANLEMYLDAGGTVTPDHAGEEGQAH
jgi:hypothetical protein